MDIFRNLDLDYIKMQKKTQARRNQRKEKNVEIFQDVSIS